MVHVWSFRDFTTTYVHTCIHFSLNTYCSGQKSIPYSGHSMNSDQFSCEFLLNITYILHIFIFFLGCHDNATILAGLCTHNRPSGNIKCYAKLKVFTRSGRVATSKWPRLWSFKIIKGLRATLCNRLLYAHLLFCCKPG